MREQHVESAIVISRHLGQEPVEVVRCSRLVRPAATSHITVFPIGRHGTAEHPGSQRAPSPHASSPRPPHVAAEMERMTRRHCGHCVWRLPMAAQRGPSRMIPVDRDYRQRGGRLVRRDCATRRQESQQGPSGVSRRQVRWLSSRIGHRRGVGLSRLPAGRFVSARGRTGGLQAGRTRRGCRSALACRCRVRKTGTQHEPDQRRIPDA